MDRRASAPIYVRHQYRQRSVQLRPPSSPSFFLSLLHACRTRDMVLPFLRTCFWELGGRGMGVGRHLNGSDVKFFVFGTQDWSRLLRASHARRRTGCWPRPQAPRRGIRSHSFRTSGGTCGSRSTCYGVRLSSFSFPHFLIRWRTCGLVPPEVLELKGRRGQLGQTDCEFWMFEKLRLDGRSIL